MDDVKKRFLTNTDETGRFIVKSLTTGKTYYVEPIGNGHPADWGDINPATKKIEELRKQYGEDSVQSKIYDDKMFSATVDLKNIGGFCADAGMVAVFLLDEVLKYNPNFDYHINRLWTTTLIKDFDGEVEYYIDDAEGEAHIIGTGNVNFFTTQTGF